MRLTVRTIGLARTAAEPFEVDGHDIAALREGFDAVSAAPGPSALIAKTVPSKGVKIFDRFPRVHYLRTTPDVWQEAADELDGEIGRLERGSLSRS